MATDNKVIVQRLYDEVWNLRRLELLDLLVSPSHALHGPQFSGRATGPEAYQGTLQLYLAAYPDIRVAIEETIAEGEKVVCNWTMTGTHQGEFHGVPATGKKICVDGVTIHHLSNGKIMDSYVTLDMWSMMQQLGVVPALGLPQSASAR